jgi:hypothetical protein
MLKRTCVVLLQTRDHVLASPMTYQFWDACEFRLNMQNNLPSIAKGDSRFVESALVTFSLQAVKNNSFSVFR